MVPGHYANEQRINALGGYHKPQHSKRIRVCGWHLDQRPYICMVSTHALSHTQCRPLSLLHRPIRRECRWNVHCVHCHHGLGERVSAPLCILQACLLASPPRVVLSGNIRYTRALTILPPPLFFLFSIVGATLDTLNTDFSRITNHRGFLPWRPCYLEELYFFFFLGAPLKMLHLWALAHAFVSAGWPSQGPSTFTT